MEELLGNLAARHSSEGFVIKQIISALPWNVEPYFYRTGAGAEVDLVLAKSNRVLLCIEVKLSLSPSLKQ